MSVQLTELTPQWHKIFRNVERSADYYNRSRIATLDDLLTTLSRTAESDLKDRQDVGQDADDPDRTLRTSAHRP